MKKIVLFLFFLLLIACGSETRSIKDAVNWKFEKLYVYNNKPLTPELRDILLQSTVAFSHDTVIINGCSRAKFIREKESTDVFFGNSDIYKEFYVGIFRDRGIDISDSLSYIRLVSYDYNIDQFSFDSYTIWQTIICTEEYLCLPYDKLKAMLFKNPVSPNNRNLSYNEKHTKIVEQEKSANRTRSIIKPSAYSLPYKGKLDWESVNYELLSESDIVQPDNPEQSCRFVDGTIKYIPMPIKGEFKVIIAPQDGGDFSHRYYLYTLGGNKIIDGIYVEGEWCEPDNDEGVEKTSFLISSDYTISIYTTFGGKTDLAKYYINDQGKFCEIKD